MSEPINPGVQKLFDAAVAESKKWENWSKACREAEWAHDGRGGAIIRDDPNNVYVRPAAPTYP